MYASDYRFCGCFNRGAELPAFKLCYNKQYFLERRWLNSILKKSYRNDNDHFGILQLVKDFVSVAVYSQYPQFEQLKDN